jgi:hypothetical protein
MSPVFATRRRAEEFNTLVEAELEGLHERSDNRYADVLSLVEQLRTLEPPTPRPDFTAALREQLMEAADTLLVPAEVAAERAAVDRLALPPRRTARDRWVAAAVGAVAVIGAGTSIAVAAQSALPGEMLYPVKRMLESAETGARLSDSGKGISMLSNAADRLAEVTALSRTSDLDESDTIASTLDTFSEQSLEASELLLDDYAQSGDASSLENLNQFTASSMETLNQLEAVLPPGARDELEHAAEVIVEIDAAVSAACPVCRGGLEQIPPALLSLVQLNESDVTVPPLEDLPANTGGGRESEIGGGTKNGSPGKGDGNGGDTSPVDLPELPTLNDDPQDPTGPIDGLLDGLTGQTGDKNASSGGSGGGKTGGKDGAKSGDGNLIDDTVGAVEDVIDLLDDPLAP